MVSLFEKLQNIKNKSYSEKSNYKVACIVEMKDGTLFEGVNIENPSFKDGLCAEQVAIGTGVANGYTKYDFERIYLLGSSNYSITPCFLCRQLIIEFFETNKKIISYSNEGKEKEYKISELCPYAFTEKELDNNDK